MLLQVGVTPEMTEVPICKATPKCIKMIEEMPESEKPIMPDGPDPKVRDGTSWMDGVN